MMRYVEGHIKNNLAQVQSLHLLRLWINFCKYEAYHEIHENLYTLKIATRLVGWLKVAGYRFAHATY